MLKLMNVSKFYRTETSVTQALRRINLELSMGEFVVVTGESGSGKSTLLNVLSGLDTYEEGEMMVAGEETSHYSSEDWEHHRSQYIGFVFQNFNIIDSYTVYQNVLSALIIQGYDESRRKDRAIELIRRVGLEPQKNQKASTLSGGQKQRVSIARALAKDSPIIVADEPTGNLDKKTGEQIVNLLHDVSKDKLVIVVSHGADAFAHCATRRVRLFDGEVVENVVLKKPDKAIDVTPEPTYRMGVKELALMAARNLRSMPKRLMLMLVVSTLIVFGMAVVYGSSLSADAIGFGGSNNQFENPNVHRLILARWDGEPFTSDELERFSAMRRVDNVIAFDPVLDITLHTTESFHYPYRFSPADAAGLRDRDLDDGRLPQNPGEVVITQSRGSGYRVGDTLTLGVGPPAMRWFGDPEGNEDPFLETIEVTIVGVVQSFAYPALLYASDDFLTRPFYAYHAVMETVETTFSFDDTLYTRQGLRVTFDETLTDNSVRLPADVAGSLANELGIQPEDLVGETVSLGMVDVFAESTNLSVTVVSIDEPDNVLTLNEATFDSLFVPVPRQVTLTVHSALDAQRLMDAFDEEIHVMYPADYVPMWAAAATLFERILNVVLLGGFMVVVYFVTYLTLKNIMQARTKDYVIFRSIGASKRSLYRITVLELAFVFILSLFLVLAFLILNRYSLGWMNDFLRYYRFSNYLVLLIMLTALAVLSGVRFNRRIFKDSVITALRAE